MGAGVFQMPADASVLKDEKLRETFETYWSVPGQSATDRMKLLNLAWDLLGSDFAGRHTQYEKFYAGPGFVMNSYSYGGGSLGRVGRISGWALGEHPDAGRDAEKIIKPLLVWWFRNSLHSRRKSAEGISEPKPH